MPEEKIWKILESRCKIRYQGMRFDYARSFKSCIGAKRQRVESLGLVQVRPRHDGRGVYEMIVWAPVADCEVVA